MDVRRDSRHRAVPATSAADSRRSGDVWLLAASYAAVYVAVSWSTNAFVLTPDVVDATWLDGEWNGSATEMSARRQRWILLGYVLTPFLIVTKIGFTAVCLAVGIALADWEVRFLSLFRVSVHAEIVWASAAVVQLICLLYVVDVESAFDYTTFYPLSALHLVEIGGEQLWSVYLLKTLNAFELLYVAALIAGMRRVVRASVWQIAGVTAASYGVGTLLLVAVVTLALMALT